jgi:hypothetical protein
MVVSRLVRRWYGRVNSANRACKQQPRLRRSNLSLHMLEERAVPATIIVTTNSDTVAVDGKVSLREAIQSFNNGANFNADVVATGTYGVDDKIQFAVGVSSITLVSGQLLIAAANGLTIEGPGAANLTISGAAAASTTNRIFDINVPSFNPTISISGLTLANGNLMTSGNNGGAIRVNNDPLVVTGVVFQNNKTESLGGAIATTASTAASITINNCAFTNNVSTGVSGGGAIYGVATLTLDIGNTTFTGNTANANGGAITAASVSTITINSSVFTGNVGGSGAAIRSSSTTTFNAFDTVFTNNTSSGTGGALFFGSQAATTITLERCTVSGNSATGLGGGLYMTSASTLNVRYSAFTNNTGAGGGGLRFTTAIVNIVNSTISGNKSTGTTATTGGGGILIGGAPNVNIYNSTIAHNQSTNSLAVGGGIFVNSTTGTITLNSTILANNVHANTRDFAASGARDIAGSNNIIGALDSAYTLTGTANQTGSEAVPFNPGIFQLASNGGLTQTVGLQYTSPALNAGSNLLGLLNDQRGPGFPRENLPSDPPDIGAFEGIVNLPFPHSASIANVVTGGGSVYTFTVTYDAKDGINTGSLGTNDVTVAGPFATGPIVFKGFTVDGKKVTATYEFEPPGMTWNSADNGAYTVTLNAGAVTDTNGGGVQGQVLGTITVAVPNVYVVNQLGDVDDGLPNNGLTTLREAINLSNNTNKGVADIITFDPALNGMTITLSGTNLEITDPVIIQGNGPANTKISGNKLSRIFLFNIADTKAESSISGVTLTEGQVTGTGGAVAVAANRLTMTNVVLVDNKSTTGGGGAHVTTGVLRIVDSLVQGNTTQNAGGGVGGTTGTVEITRSTITGNFTAGGTGNGGGLYSTSGTLVIVDSTISKNTSGSTTGTTGGGAFRVTAADVAIINSTISGNSVPSGGGGAILATGAAKISIFNSTIVNNSSGSTTPTTSGGISFSSGTPTSGLTVKSSIIANNTHGTHPDLFAANVNFTALIDNSIIGINSSGMIINGSGNFNGDPMLAPLANYGGPTETHGILPGSLAINNGSNVLNLSFDQRGPGFPRQNLPSDPPDIGSFEGVLAVPQANATLPNVVAPAATYVATVVYSGVVDIKVSSIGLADVLLSGPGYGTPVSPVSFNVMGSGTSVTATYTFNAPGLLWSSLHNGTYTLTMVANQVENIDGVAVMAGSLGTFAVAIPFTYVVNQTGDGDDMDFDNGMTTLREAIRLANSKYVNVRDVITFDSSLNGKTITLGSELVITDPVVIQGLGANNLKISGANNVRIFNFNIAGPGAESQISDITLTQGRTTANGGAIVLVDDSLTLTNVVISDSFATTSGGAISMTSGTLKIIDSRLTNNFATTTGGGVSSTTGTIEVVRSTISGNTATTTGGGLYVTTGTLNVSYSTLSGNIANGTGSTQGGGGLSFTTGKVTIVNSTIADNMVPNGSGVGGGIRGSSSGTLNIYNSTIAGNSAPTNGGGFAWTGTTLATMPTVNIASTIIGANSAIAHPDLFGAATSVTLTITANNSLISLDTGKVGISGLGNVINFDPQLAVLGNYGGPTATRPLLPGSPAVNNGSNELKLNFDQRGAGFPRETLPSDPADIGAVEGELLNPTATATLGNVTMTGTQYKATVVYTDETGINLGSIGLSDVLLSGPGYALPVSPVAFTPFGSGLTVTVEYVFNAPGGAWTAAHNGTYTLTMKANEVFDIDMPTPRPVFPGVLGTFQVAIPTSFVVNQTGDVDDMDPNNGQTTLREAIRMANQSGGTPDTITFAGSLNGQTITLGSELLINDPVVIQGPGSTLLKISGNNANRLFNFAITGAGAESKISGLTLMDGKVTGNGGAILLNDDGLTLTEVVVHNNEATSNGGAIHLTGGKLMVINSALTSNKTTGSTTSGGAIGTTTSTAVVDIINSTVSGNTATANGGGLYVTTGTLNITNSTITMNTALSKYISYSYATSGGGGVSTTSGKVTISNSSITNNVALGTALGIGGGLRFVGNGTFTISATTISGNTAGSNGGGIALTAGQLKVEYSTLSGNKVDGTTFGGGGAISIQGSSASAAQATFINSTLSGNAVVGNPTATFIMGGAIRMTSGTLTVNNSTITDNSVSASTATTNGGGGLGLSLTSVNVIVNSSIIAQNHHPVDPDLFSTPTATVNITFTDSLVGAVTDPSIGMGGTFIAGDLANPLDAQLSPLGDYGGPTQTHALSPTSPAIDAGNNNLLLNFDQRGTGFPRVTGAGMQADIGAFEGLSPIPLAFANLTDVAAAGGSLYTFTVTYSDDIGINTGTLGDDDLLISGPGFAMPIAAKFVNFTGSGGKIEANYSFVPPGGTWDGLDNGDYTVTMNANAVSDGKNFVPAGPIGSFRVGIAANFVVDSKIDEDDFNYGSGDLSLREAVRLANATIMGASTVAFAPSLNGQTITLILGELAITRNMNIVGLGASKLTVSGNNASRIFTINDGNAATNAVVNLSGMTLTQGKSAGDGGAINIQNENVTLNGMVITGNTAFGAGADGGGINVEGAGATFTMLNSIVSFNNAGASGDADGGGINFEAAVTVLIRGSTIANNTAFDDGGGLLFHHSVSTGRSVLIEDSAIVNNVASGGTSSYGGGVNFGGQFDSLVIRNSTVSGNTATIEGGGLQFYNVDSPTTIQNSTIVGNSAGTKGGGLNQYKGSSSGTTSEGIVILESTIVSNNYAATGPDLSSVDGTVTAQFSALGKNAIIFFTDLGNNLFDQDLKLGALADNGGPSPTHALLIGSPAINAGFNPNLLTTDQRGFKREVGLIDIGAYEVQVPGVASVTIDDGTGQRSLVRSIQVKFTEDVSFPDGLAAAFQVSRFANGSVGNVALNLVQSGRDVTITFKAGGTVGVDPGNSLLDGTYRLTIVADKVSGSAGTLDGNGNQTSEGSPIDNYNAEFHRLFGDADGNGAVTATDFNAFRLAYNTAGPSIFDFDGVGGVTAIDFNEFRLRYGVSGYLP